MRKITAFSVWPTMGSWYGGGPYACYCSTILSRPTSIQFVSTATGCLVQACRRHRATNATKQSGRCTTSVPARGWVKSLQCSTQCTSSLFQENLWPLKYPVHLVSPNHCCSACPIFLYELALQGMALLSALPTHSLTYVNLEESKVAHWFAISP